MMYYMVFVGHLQRLMSYSTLKRIHHLLSTPSTIMNFAFRGLQRDQLHAYIWFLSQGRKSLIAIVLTIIFLRLCSTPQCLDSRIPFNTTFNRDLAHFFMHFHKHAMVFATLLAYILCFGICSRTQCPQAKFLLK